MKNIRVIAAALILALALSGACAESIFPELTPIPTAELTPAPVAVLAPSYGMMANVAADEVSLNAQNGTMVTYRNVTADGFNRFGAYLGERGYAVTDTQTQGEQTAYALSDGQTEFVMFYTLSAQTMTLVYPQGTDWEQPRFPGYQTLAFGEEVLVPNLGRFKVNDFQLNHKLSLTGMVERLMGENYYYDIDGNELYSNKTRSVYTYCEFRFFNTMDRAIPFSANGNELLTMTLHYISATGEYTYEQTTPAAYSSKFHLFLNGYRAVYDDLSISMALPVQSMTESFRSAVFEVPAGVRESTDGTIYVTIEFATGDKYVVLLREDGRNIYEPWEN